MSFRDNLQHLRAQRNMTQEQLAMLVGVSRQSVTKWEAERAYPEMDKLLRLCQIFEVTLDDLVCGDVAHASGVKDEKGDAAGEADSTHAVPQVPAGPATDVCGYDELMRRFSARIASGVALIIVGTVLPGFFQLAFGASDEVAVTFLFVALAFGIGMIILAAMDHLNFRHEHPYIEDFYTTEDRRRARAQFARSLVAGIALVFAAIITLIIIGEAGYEDTSVVAFMLVLAPGVWLFVHGGILVSRIDVKGYNRDSVDELDVDDIVRSEGITPEQREYLLGEKLGAHGRARQLAGRACGIIMLVATAIALIWLFMAEALGAPGNLRDYFWLPWPIGGLCCAVAGIVLSGSEEG